MFAELSELSSRDYNADCVAAHLSVLGEKVQYSAPEDSQLPDPGAAEADTAEDEGGAEEGGEEGEVGGDVEMVSQTQCCGGLKKSAVCSVL